MLGERKELGIPDFKEFFSSFSKAIEIMAANRVGLVC